MAIAPMRTDWSLEDIGDVRRYVHQVVARKMPGHLNGADPEEIVAEGIAIVHGLHRKWEPERCKSFADYVSTYLPFRLIDWWRKEMRQRGICCRRGGQGYDYAGVSSLQALGDKGFELQAPRDGRLGD